MKVVIIGGGFAGTVGARALPKKHHVELIDPASAERPERRRRLGEVVAELRARHPELGDANDANTLRTRERLLAELEALHRARSGEAG